MISDELRAAVKLSSARQYQIAARAGLHPSTLSRIVNGVECVRPGDPRVLRIARAVGLPFDRAFVTPPYGDELHQASRPSPTGGAAGVTGAPGAPT